MKDIRRVMIVEDSPTQALRLQVELEKQSWNVACVGSANEALAAIGREPPDIIVVDYQLPGMRGDELCRQLRMSIHTRHIPIVMLTADENENVELRGLDSGADDFFIKSCDTEYLVRRIGAMLEKSAQLAPILRPLNTQLQRARILAVDDSTTYLAHLTALLEQEGYCVEAVHHGLEALERVKQNTFDCVLVDLVMPEVDGIEVCRRITAMREGLDNPIAVLMLTGREGKDDLTRALEAGADDFVGKSSDVAVLKGRIRALLRRKFYQEENQRILEELNNKELEAARARAEKEAAEARIAHERQHHAEEVAEQLRNSKVELERSNEELKKSNDELRQFVHVASHDLQEPLRSITCFCDLLKEDCADRLSDVADDCLERIVSGAARMKSLVQDLLAYARVSHDQANPMKSVECELALTDAMANLQCSIDETQAEITWDHLPTLRASRAQFVQLLQNLIGNSLIYRSGATPEIHVACVGREEHWEFSVRDNGIGIAAEYHTKIFEIFKRLHDRTQYPGTGIGLAVCKRIVEKHGGRIWVESDPGQGTTFHFTIPHSSQDQPDEPAGCCVACS